MQSLVNSSVHNHVLDDQYSLRLQWMVAFLPVCSALSFQERNAGGGWIVAEWVNPSLGKCRKGYQVTDWSQVPLNFSNPALWSCILSKRRQVLCVLRMLSKRWKTQAA